MTEDIVIEVRTLARLGSAPALGRLGRVLDASAAFRPERMGPREPVRRSVRSVEEHLTQWAPSIVPGTFYVQLFEGGSGPDLIGQLTVMGDHPSSAPSVLSISISEALQLDWEVIADEFRRLCEAMDAYYGFASYTPLLRQRMDAFMRARSTGQMSASNLMDTSYRPDEHAVDDVFWLNYFGPAYVQHWGHGRFNELDVQGRATANGGIVVRMAESPLQFDPRIGSIASYAWKQPLYDGFGLETFLHEEWREPGRGVRLPTYDEHLAQLLPADDPRLDPAARSTPPGATTQRSQPLARRRPDWDRLVAMVRLFREIGFFADRREEVESLATDLVADLEQRWGQFRPNDPMAGLRLLSLDSHRVWWEDTEADVNAGGNVYVRVLAEWASISRGAFSPTGISEEWAGDAGPLLVRFEADGIEHEVAPRFLGDYLDLAVLGELNRIIAKSGLAYCTAATHDQTAFVVVLRQSEHVTLGSHRLHFVAVPADKAASPSSKP